MTAAIVIASAFALIGWVLYLADKRYPPKPKVQPLDEAIDRIKVLEEHVEALRLTKGLGVSHGRG